tara:strand:- start:131 stop:613 length:483 start_codon:yes stop_codon:yes gene_type:complete
MADSIPHLFQSIQVAPKKHKVDLLRRLNEHCKEILHHAFHPNIKFLLPEGTPPYVFRGTPEAFPTSLYPEVRTFYIFCEGGGANVNQIRREAIFIQLLEKIHPDEAKVVIAMKDKKFNELYDTITYDVVREAFPDMLPEREVKKKSPGKKSGGKGRQQKT